MGQIALSLQLFIFAVLIVAVAYAVGRAVSNLIWCTELERFVMALLFRSFKWFRISFTLLILLFVAYPVKELLLGDNVLKIVGLLIMTLSLATSGYIFKGLGKFHERYDYHRASTSVQLYKTNNLVEREFAYHAMMNCIINADYFTKTSPKELQEIADTVFNQRFGQILTFEWFDRELNISNSKNSVGKLFVRNFDRDIKALIKAVQMKVDDVELTVQGYSEICNELQKQQYLRFDDRKGVHYDEVSVLNRIDEIIANQLSSEIFSIGSISNITEEHNLGLKLEEDTSMLIHLKDADGAQIDEPNISDSLRNKEIRVLMNTTNQVFQQIKKIQPRIRVELENCTREECINFYLNHLQLKLQVTMTRDNIADVKKLFKDHFIENGKRTYIKGFGPYRDSHFFGTNKANVIAAFSALANRFGCEGVEKTKIAEMLVQALPEHFTNEKSIKSRLSQRN